MDHTKHRIIANLIKADGFIDPLKTLTGYIDAESNQLVLSIRHPESTQGGDEIWEDSIAGEDLAATLEPYGITIAEARRIAGNATAEFQIYCDRGRGPELDGCWGSEDAKGTDLEAMKSAAQFLADTYTDCDWVIKDSDGDEVFRIPSTKKPSDED